MRVFSLNFGNVKLNKLNSVCQNSISFKAQDQEPDTVELSDKISAQCLISKLQKENEELRQKISKYSRQIKEAEQKQESELDFLYSPGLCNATLRHLKEELAKNEQKIRNLSESPKFALLYGDKPEWKKASPSKKKEMVKKLGLSIDINEPKYEKISPNAKKAIVATLEQLRLQRGAILINNQNNNQLLAKFDGYYVETFEDFKFAYGISDPLSLFPDSLTINVKGCNLILVPSNDVTDLILNDIKSGKAATISKLTDEKGFDITTLPVAFKKYSGVVRTSEIDTKGDECNSGSDSDELYKLDFCFVDLENEKIKEILSYSMEGKRFLAQLPFEVTRNKFVNYIDINNPKNRKLLETIQDLYPKKSQYCIDRQNNKSKKAQIPVSHLAELGYSSVKSLVDLIESGKLSGFKDENGRYFVSLNIDIQGKADKNLTVLNMLRENNPNIKRFNDFAKALNVEHSALNQAIFNGEVDIIGEYINPADREIRYINIGNSKNQEFIRKIRFEQAIKATLSNLQRAEQQEAKNVKLDYKQRLAGVRMALVWEFMPNTKIIASKLAKSYGHISKLLAKSDEPNEKLTSSEEVVLAKYRKELWLQAGTQELREAYRKAADIMNIFKEQGLSAVDSEYLPIFEKYGFVLA